MPKKNLDNARRGRNDEFYTRLEDIENELSHYEKHFDNKVVLCNCDDPRISNFFTYFSERFYRLKLMRLMVSCYKPQDFDLFSESHEPAVWLEYDGELVDKCVPSVDDIGLNAFKGDGDFRSPESIELLKQADIVVTNPPFSLFREYVAQLMEYNKKFLIIGNQNAITYKDFFPLIKEGKVWLGYGFKRNCAHFYSPFDDTASDLDHRDGMIRVSGVNWFTNLEHEKRNKRLELTEAYSPEKYPKYDGFDAIEVPEVKLIPKDYDGIMGVPITFLCKHCPEQFEIVGELHHGCDNEYDLGVPVVNGKCLYVRVLIRRKQ